MSNQIRYPDGRVFGPCPPEDIRSYAAAGTLPEGTEVGTTQGWKPLGAWLASIDASPAQAPTAQLPVSVGGVPRRSNREPTRCLKLTLSLFLVPPAWLIAHVSLLSTKGSGAIWAIWGVASVVALVIGCGRGRTQTPSQILTPLFSTSLRKKATFGGLGVVVALISLLGAWGAHSSARTDVELGVAAKTPCGIEALGTLDQSELSPDQNERVSDLRSACEEHRQREAPDKVANEAAQNCERLVAAIVDGHDYPEETAKALALESEVTQFYQRLLRRQLARGDLAKPLDGLPCARGRLFAVAVEAAGTSADLWRGQVELAADIVRALVPRGLPEEATRSLRRSTAERATAASRTEDVAEQEGALIQCELAERLKATATGECATLLAVKEAQEKARERRQLADEARCERLIASRRQCGDQCEDAFDLYDPRLDTCIARCGEGALTGRVPGCE